jgi:hypothetical protein
VAEQAPGYFRAVAIDFDGTLADGPVAPGTLAALAEARARQIRVILVTGRIMSELRAVFPDVDDHVDAVVAENGAVLLVRAGLLRLAPPVDRAVSEGLAARGIAHRRGQVPVACAADDEPAASGVIRELGLDCQLVRNRGELMILPAGVTKGTGLLEALGALGLSRHNTIGVGDLDAAGQAGYAARLTSEVEAHRAATGLPQWVAVDEAHGPIGRNGAAHPMFNRPPKATCSSPGSPRSSQPTRSPPSTPSSPSARPIWPARSST